MFSLLLSNLSNHWTSWPES